MSKKTLKTQLNKEFNSSIANPKKFKSFMKKIGFKLVNNTISGYGEEHTVTNCLYSIWESQEKKCVHIGVIIDMDSDSDKIIAYNLKDIQ